MKSNKLVEAIVTANSTPQIQMKLLLRNIQNPVQFLIELTVLVFRLPEKERTFLALEKELSLFFMKKLGLWGVLKATIIGIIDADGPIEGIQKAVITKACFKMGLRNPVKLSGEVT